MTPSVNVPAGLNVPGSHFSAAYRVLADAIASRAFPGCAFGVFAGGQVVLQDALGRFTYEQDSSAVAVDTPYDVASLTKVVATTAASMLLKQRGLLDLDTPLGEVLPGFVVGRSPPRCTPASSSCAICWLIVPACPATPSFFAAQPPLRRCSAPASTCPSKPNRAPVPNTPIPASFCSAGSRTGHRRRAFPLDTARDIYSPWPVRHRFNPSSAARLLIPPTEEDTSFRHRLIQGEVQDENAWVLKGVSGPRGPVLECARPAPLCGRNSGSRQSNRFQCPSPPQRSKWR